MTNLKGEPMSKKVSDSDDLKSVMAQYPDMDIYAPAGTKVRPIYYKGEPCNGTDYDKTLVKRHLAEGATFTVESTDVHNWSTDVHLEEVPHVAFNSVCLSPVKPPRNSTSR